MLRVHPADGIFRGKSFEARCSSNAKQYGASQKWYQLESTRRLSRSHIDASKTRPFIANNVDPSDPTLVNNITRREACVFDKIIPEACPKLRHQSIPIVKALIYTKQYLHRHQLLIWNMYCAVKESLNTNVGACSTKTCDSFNSRTTDVWQAAKDVGTQIASEIEKDITSLLDNLGSLVTPRTSSPLPHNQLPSQSLAKCNNSCEQEQTNQECPTLNNDQSSSTTRCCFVRRKHKTVTCADADIVKDGQFFSPQWRPKPNPNNNHVNRRPKSNLPTTAPHLWGF